MHASRPLDADAQAHDGLTPAQRRRREAIISATSDMLATREPAQIHMRDIAAEAGVALGTLYRYFPSKELLYAHCVAAWGQAFAPMTRTQNSKAASDAERISRVLRRTVKAYERWPNFYRLIALLEITEDSEARSVYQVFYESYRALLATVLVDTDPDDAAVVVQMLLSSLGNALGKWFLGEWKVEAVHAHVTKAVELIFGQPRKRA